MLIMGLLRKVTSLISEQQRVVTIRMFTILRMRIMASFAITTRMITFQKGFTSLGGTITEIGKFMETSGGAVQEEKPKLARQALNLTLNQVSPSRNSPFTTISLWIFGAQFVLFVVIYKVLHFSTIFFGKEDIPQLLLITTTIGTADQTNTANPMALRADLLTPLSVLPIRTFS